MLMMMMIIVIVIIMTIMILMMIRTFFTTKSQSEAVFITVLPRDFSTAGNGLTWLHQLFACKTSDNFVTLPA